jgi:hypothetical protein
VTLTDQLTIPGTIVQLNNQEKIELLKIKINKNFKTLIIIKYNSKINKLLKPGFPAYFPFS